MRARSLVVIRRAAVIAALVSVAATVPSVARASTAAPVAGLLGALITQTPPDAGPAPRPDPAVRGWETKLARMEAVALMSRLPLTEPADAKTGPSRMTLQVPAAAGLRSAVALTFGAQAGPADGDRRSAVMTATLTAPASRRGAQAATIFRLPIDVRIRQELIEGEYPCPGTALGAPDGTARGYVDGVTDYVMYSKGHRPVRSHVRIHLTLNAVANRDAGLRSFDYTWTISGPGFGSYGERGSDSGAGRVTRDRRTRAGARSSLPDEARSWADDQAARWAKVAHDTWDTRHLCVALTPLPKGLDVPPNITFKLKITPKPTHGHKQVKQKLTINGGTGLRISPAVATASAAQPAVFTITNVSTASALRRAHDPEGPETLDIEGRSDDGRSVLDLPIDTQPPIATVQNYAVQQSNTGQGPGTSGQRTISEALADHSAQAYPAYCEASECHLSLWIDDAVTASGSAHRAGDDNNAPCDESSGPSTVDDPDIGVTNVYLDYNSDGYLTAAHLEQAPYAPAVGDPNNGGDHCYTALADNIPYPDWVEQPLDLTALGNGTSLLENFTRSGTFDLGEAGSISYDWHSQLGFSIANAGTPAGS